MNVSAGKTQGWISKFLSNLSGLNFFILVYVLTIALIYLCSVFVPERIFGYRLSTPAVTYIILSATAIILSTWGERISLFIRRLFFKNMTRSQQLQILDQKRFRFLLILIYFLAIIIFTMASLTNTPIFDIDQMDYSIIQSFATYISYDRMVRNYPTIAKNGKDTDCQQEED